MTVPPDVLMQQAAALHSQGRRLEAIALFRQVLAALPESSEGWYELGYLLKAESQYVEALDAYGQALAKGVTRPEEVHLNRAVIYSDHLRRDEDAQRELRAALELARTMSRRCSISAICTRNAGNGRTRWPVTTVS